MPHTQKAVFLDIDGTLILGKRGPFNEDIEAIEEARKQGHLFFLNTGRGFGNLPPVLRDAPWIDGMVCGAGAQILFRGKTVHCRAIPEKALLEISAFYLNSKKWCVFEGETALYGINENNSDLFVTDILSVKNKDDFLTRYKDAQVTKLSIDGSASAEEQALLEDYFDLNPFPDYFEGILKGESKSHGMELILKELGIARENSVAMGDSFNDMSMIRYAGLGIAMGNACDELKQMAGAITADCGQGGIAQAVKKWVLT
ncbi:HAD-superfamily hydrolase, subfamily IIB [Treponema primitia ZAS-2]|uniref:HAD-superfamily hydrolase, subfamily IIB n=1 Tax=Treponema primitia (strain ATCC BAA-887 / DSM 12427 / ZAS-2) TaxID=545694 RepID=F5YQT5_TREPZ|nr:HAD hydrolase family protein [Treponema primitia]AEF86002.1 HAD-superfamily hydrolase, subfamily IIB [Treponema primitia ZAS-2]